MTGLLWLDWASMAVSVFNMSLLLWLGLMVLLNAERHDWGVWFTGGGMLAGAAFFFSHSALLGYGPSALRSGVNLWWRAGWGLLILAPLAWYIMTLWYSGYWSSGTKRLRRRHRPWLIGLLLLAIFMVSSLPFSNLFPAYADAVLLDASKLLSVAGIPVILIAYAAFMILLVVLSIDALLHPDQTRRLMGDLARQRTRPWLIGASGILLVISVLVTGFMLWAASSARQGPRVLLTEQRAIPITAFDLLVAALVSAAVLLVGQAIVSYEVFTGKALPRGGFFKQWRTAILLCAGFSIPMTLALTLNLRPVYAMLAPSVLMISFYALLGWQSFEDREHLINSLRPFVRSQRLIDGLRASGEDDAGAQVTFNALCADVLNTGVAQLTPLGALTPLVDRSLYYPPKAQTVERSALPIQIGPEEKALFLRVPPNSGSALRWAIPLRAGESISGVLLLGHKSDGGLYTEEEFEIARASAERLLDTLASQEMTRRLAALQRQRLMGSQIMDRRVRRSLHDEVLPELHMAILNLSQFRGEHEEIAAAVDTLSQTHHQIADLIRAMPDPPSSLPRSTQLIEALRALIGSEMESSFDAVHWHCEEPLPTLNPLVSEVIFYAAREALRNAAQHARGPEVERLLRIEIQSQSGPPPALLIRDDGVGPVARDFEPETRPGAGRGLALHSTMLAVIGGSLAVEAAPGGGTLVRITLPEE